MSRVYAVDDHGDRFLRYIECDNNDCFDENGKRRRIEPHPEIAQSGWTKRGGMDKAGCKWESDYCPEHS